MPYAIKRNPTPGRPALRYLARGHGTHRWTEAIEKVRLFSSYEAADRERCPENETVIELSAED